MPNASTSKKVLVAPLDWGLGHATRCIPVITELLDQGYGVQIASSGGALVLLKEEFSFLKFHCIESYDVKYSGSLPFIIKIALQIPKFLKAIQREHQQIKKIVHDEKIGLIISDNRYGCWSKKTENIFICHQLTLKTSVFSSFTNFFHRRAIERFSECWVPDEEGKESLAGELSVSPSLNLKYIGLLSRMKWELSQIQYDILAIISGPEPQRSALEEIVLTQLSNSSKRCLVVRGLPGDNQRTIRGNLEIINHLNAQEMNRAILESAVIISRSGYSTIMDLAMLGKRAIFIPTPGQVEQEYLAKELMRKKIAFSVKQDNFNLQQALSKLNECKGFGRRNENNKLRKAIENLDETN